MAWVKVTTVSEVPAGGRKLVEVEGIPLAIFHLNGEWYAIEDTCTHDGGPLVEGELIDHYVVECPRHGARFDIRTGAVLRMPAIEPVPTYEVKVEGSDIYVDI